MGYDEGLTYNEGALEVGKAGLEPASSLPLAMNSFASAISLSKAAR